MPSNVLDWMVVEADESDGSFALILSTNIIITNIDSYDISIVSGFDDPSGGEIFLQFIIEHTFLWN